MNIPAPDSIGLIAGKGVYPLLLAQSAKKQGVKNVFAIAFSKETKPEIEKYADEVKWIRLGQLQAMLDTLQNSGIKHAVMAGQITPTHLFRVRMDKRMISLLKQLTFRNAETIFGAVANELKSIGIQLMPASMFMENHMSTPGIMTKRTPSDSERTDVDLGVKAAQAISSMNIGQTVVIKNGTVLAVEAFEGTDDTIKRAGKLGGPGSVVVKLAKHEHDMRFDIPVIGIHTIKMLKQIKASVLAIEAGRSILLEQDRIIKEANKIGLSLIVLPPRT